MGFFSQIEGPIKQVLDQIFADPGLNVEITYRLHTGQGSFDHSTGSRSDTFTDYTLTVVRLRHTQGSQLVGIANIQVGDELYLLKGEDISSIAGDFSLKDEIVNENSVSQTIKSINDIFGLATAVTVNSGATS